MNLDERLHAYRNGLERAIDERAEAGTHRADSSAVRPRDRSRVIVAIALVAVVAMLSSAVVGLVHHFKASTNGPLTIEAITATTLGESARIAATYTATDDNAQPKQTSFTTTGLYDFDHDVARIEQPPPAPTAGGPATTGSTELLYVGGKIYSNISPSIASAIPERARRGKRWIVEAGPTGVLGPGADNPFTALAQIRSRATSLVDLGVTRVDGQAVHHYHAVEQRPTSATPPTSGAPTTVRIGYDLYVDGRKRLVRLVITEPTIGSFSSLQQRLDFTDYGVHVDVVAPPTDEVLDFDDVNPVFAPPRVTGPWTRVASGSTGGYTWKLYRAPADHERVCWSFEPNPSVPNNATNGETLIGGGERPPPLQHDGLDATCSRTGVWASPLQYVFTGSRVTGAGSNATVTSIVVAIVDDEVASVESRTAAGSVTPITIDARFGGFVDVSPEASYTLHLRDGRTVDCDGGRPSIFSAGSVPTCPALGE